MGLNMTAYWLSWFITYTIITLIEYIIITIIFPGEDHVKIKLYYWRSDRRQMRFEH